jgi:hypothetical protein
MRIIKFIIYTSLIYDVGNASIKRHGDTVTAVAECQSIDPIIKDTRDYFENFKESYIPYSENGSVDEYLEELNNQLDKVAGLVDSYIEGYESICDRKMDSEKRQYLKHKIDEIRDEITEFFYELIRELKLKWQLRIMEADMKMSLYGALGTLESIATRENVHIEFEDVLINMDIKCSEYPEVWERCKEYSRHVMEIYEKKCKQLGVDPMDLPQIILNFDYLVLIRELRSLLEYYSNLIRLDSNEDSIERSYWNGLDEMNKQYQGQELSHSPEYDEELRNYRDALAVVYKARLVELGIIEG